ncbi:MAG: hypothetical protein AB1752_11305 [Candidatus Zixiibacteriota bacterium]
MERSTTRRAPEISPVMLFILLLNAVLVIFLAQVVIETRRDLQAARVQLQEIEDLSRRVEPVRSPGDYLAEQCASCHSERRYLGEHGDAASVSALIRQMEAFPDAHVSVEQTDKIQGALLMMKCQRCHTDEVFSALAALNAEERRRTVLRMWEHADTRMSRQEVLDILHACERVYGY